MTAPPLSPSLAASHRQALVEERFDVLVIGGGVVGAGIALDAATRGLSVCLLEAEDFASGSSSRSSKLIHGGLRYVQALQLGLVREALRERSILRENAPHLIRPARFLYPLRHHWERPYVGAGVALYDTLAHLSSSSGHFPAGRHLGRHATSGLAPALRRDRLTGGVVYHDAQVDDARYVVALVRTAVAHGAVVSSRAPVVGLVEDGGRVVGATTTFAETGDTATVHAQATVVAAGPQTESLLRLSGGRAPTLRPSKGVHLVVPRESIDAACALIAPTKDSVIFVLPWGSHWLIGTTDTPWKLDPSRPVANRHDVEYLLREVNTLLETPIGPEDIESVYVGLRPLIAAGATATTKLSREHAITEAKPGLTAVTGGKYTTYRLMAQQALDAALGPGAPRSVTDHVPIVGADGLAEATREVLATVRGTALVQEVADRLLERYGSLAPEVLGAGGDDGLQQVAGTGGYLAAELCYGASHEGARHLDDLLVRRTRTAMETRDRGLAAAAEVAALVAPILHWDRDAVAKEVTSYRALVASDLRAEQAADDPSALAAAASPDQPGA
ncbi:MAG TPA: glycerol-3-phosphate dehydrogenase/oxidase [Acidimicrobiales bacterium]